MMFLRFSELRQPRNTGIACALAATCLGIAYLLAAGAPGRHIVVNAVAFLLGLVALSGIDRASVQTRRFTGTAILVSGALLLATALFGASADGVTRWFWIGPLGVQASFVVLPMMLVAFARHPHAISLAGIAVAAVALALQPDRAMSGVLALSMAVLVLIKPGRYSLCALAVALAAFAMTLLRPDTSPASPYVDQIFFTAFQVHILAGAAVLAGSLLLLVPSLVGWRHDPDHAHVHLVFGAIWLGCIVAAGLGNYPTPVVGYGGSAILGYILSVSFLPHAAPQTRATVVGAADDDPEQLPKLPRQASVA